MDISKGVRGQAFSSINVTPFVDVTLVLLIIFMVVGPIIVNDGVLIPEVENPETIPETQQELRVSVGHDGTVTINGIFVRLDELDGILASAFAEGPERSVVVRGDHRLLYGDITGVLKTCRDAGFRKVGLAASPIERRADM